ncbi:SrfA family protein [Proteus terrae]|nr:SrfA family protein [Proteus terrae]MCE9838208.1 SrfA family protein [Proteus terrae]
MIVVNKAFLRSGKLESYLPMGENGQAVYISALQLRETLRLRGKAHISQCLAIPQPNETGERIDWYSPIDGSVIPWSAASEEERTAAYARLKKNQDDLIAFSEQEQQRAGSKESQLFGALLSKTIQFPDENHIFIVDGQPIITFWGFVSANQQLRVDPVACLKPAVAPIAPTSTVAPPVQEKIIITDIKRPWWRFLWWLLPLLLLLLAIFFLRGCFSTPALPTVDIKTPDIEVSKLPEPTLEKPKVPTVVTHDHTVGIPTGTVHTGILGTVDANGNVINGTDGNGTVIDPNTGLPVVDPQIDNNQGALPKGATPDNAQKPNVPPVDPATQNEQPKTDTPQNAGNENNTANPPVDPNAPPDVTPPATADNTTPLTIPANALANGSTQFLNGQWKAGAGIQDQKTGKPLSLNYQLDNGKGQVVMTRSDGVTCKAPVNAAVNQGGLNIDNQGQALCSDGSNYLMPNIICQPGSQNIADCQGKYENSQPFPLSMKRENN